MLGILTFPAPLWQARLGDLPALWLEAYNLAAPAAQSLSTVNLPIRLGHKIGSYQTLIC